MIIKTKSYKHKSCFLKVHEYLLREEENQGGFLITKFIKGKDLSAENIAKQFAYNEHHYRKNKRKNSVLLFMDIISFHPDDYDKLLDNKVLKKIARRYIRKRAPHAMATVVVHRNEKKNTHLHALFSAINYKTGESIRMSKKQYQDFKLEMDTYQKSHFPFLKKSEIQHVKPVVLNKTKDAEYKMQQKRKVISDKKRVLGVLEWSYNQAQSRDVFFKLVSSKGIHLYKRGDSIVGIKIRGIKHRLSKLGYIPETLNLLNQKNLNQLRREQELEQIKQRQRSLPRDWHR